ncbi:MAG: YcxB family protein [Pseudomonadota bacterium]
MSDAPKQAPPNTPLTLRFVLVEGITPRNARAVRAYLMPHERWWNALIICSFIGCAAMPTIAPRFGFEGGGAQILLLALSLGLAIYRMIVRGRRFRAALEDAPGRQGESEMTLDPEGVRLIHPGAEYFVRWSHVEAAILAPRGLLILTSPVEYLPIPTEALPIGETPESMKARIEAWIAAARATGWDLPAGPGGKRGL